MEKRKQFLINFSYYAVIAGIIYAVLKYGIKYIMPFFIGFIVAYLCKKPIEALENKFKLKHNLSCVIVLTLAMIIMIGFCLLFGVILADGASKIFSAMPYFYSSKIEPYIERILQWYDKTDFDDYLGPAVGDILSDTATNLLSSLGSLVTTISVKVVSYTTSTLSSVPAFLLKFLLTIISAFFICFDYTTISGFIEHQFGDKVINVIKYLKVNLLDTIGKYLLSYTIILGITFGELVVLMLTAKVPSPLLLALIIALFDFMPIVGISTVFIPWIIIDLMSGAYMQAVIIFVGWLIMTIVRNIIEPKIVGDNVGLHPVVALIAMYAGLKIGGLVGMLGIPVILVVLIEMQKKGMLHFYNPLSEEEIKKEETTDITK